MTIPTEVLPNGQHFYRDKDNPNCGWIVRQGKGVIIPVEYIRRPQK